MSSRNLTTVGNASTPRLQGTRRVGGTGAGSGNGCSIGRLAVASALVLALSWVSSAPPATATEASLRPSGRVGFASISASPYDEAGAACGLDVLGRATCWGRHWFRTTSGAPPGRYASLSFGSGEACGIRGGGPAGGTLACWSFLGDRLPAPSGRFLRLDASGANGVACALRTVGGITCWWLDSPVRCAYHIPPDCNQLRQVTRSGAFLFVAAGFDVDCGVTTAGHLTCWLTPNAGTYPLCAQGYRPDPVCGQQHVPPGRYKDLSLGDGFACGLREDGIVVCWGHPARSLGQTNPPKGRFLSVSSDGMATCGIRANHTVACWGYAGDTCSAAPHCPLIYGRGAEPSAGRFIALSGGSNACGLRPGGEPVCWNGGVLGYAPGRPFKELSAGLEFCGVRTGGQLMCWRGAPTYPLRGRFKDVSTDWDWNGCAVRFNGRIACRGLASVRPRAVLPRGTFAQVSLGASGGCGLRTGGGVACWDPAQTALKGSEGAVHRRERGRGRVLRRRQ